jgi:hypothetical protein
MKLPQNLGNCVFCNKRPAVTKDHIPPKGIFLKPRPSNLVRVPACEECNSGASDLDERFMVYLGLHVGGWGGEGENFFRNGVLKALDQNRKLRKEILSKMKPVYLESKGGIIYDWGYKVLWDSEAHNAIVEKTIRGLYYHHFNEVLGDAADIKVHWYRKLTPEMAEMSKEWGVNIFGKGEVVYRFGGAIDAPLHSVWIFQFYGAHWAGGYTTPKSWKPPDLPKPIVYRGG